MFQKVQIKAKIVRNTKKFTCVKNCIIQRSSNKDKIFGTVHMHGMRTSTYFGGNINKERDTSRHKFTAEMLITALRKNVQKSTGA